MGARLLSSLSGHHRSVSHSSGVVCLVYEYSLPREKELSWGQGYTDLLLMTQRNAAFEPLCQPFSMSLLKFLVSSMHFLSRSINKKDKKLSAKLSGAAISQISRFFI